MVASANNLFANVLAPPNVEVAMGLVMPAVVDAKAEGIAVLVADLNVSLSSVIYGDAWDKAFGNIFYFIVCVSGSILSPGVTLDIPGLK